MATGAAGAPQVDQARLWRRVQEYACIGATTTDGIDRPLFSEADIQARRRLVEDCRALALAVRVDAALNVVAVRPGGAASLPSILIGSHLDSVPNGGHFDGALGVLCALEVVQTLVQHAVPTRHAVTLLSFAGEEATSYGTSTFGSRALAGRLTEIGANVLPDGRTVRQALREGGGDWEGLAEVGRSLGRVACFLEVHIEQGARLERAGQPLAVVSGVSGIYRQRIVFHGEAGHAGTTAMGERHDALRAASAFVLAVATLPSLVAAMDEDATATVGYLAVAPNAPNVIPGTVTLVTDLRSADAATLTALAGAAAEAADAAAAREAVRVEIATLLDQAPVIFSSAIRHSLREVVAEVAGAGAAAGRELASQAGHDAVHLQALAPTGMLFVRCAGGVSHRPEESVTPEDAGLAAQALLEAVLALDARLDADGAPATG